MCISTEKFFFSAIFSPTSPCIVSAVNFSLSLIKCVPREERKMREIGIMKMYHITQLVHEMCRCEKFFCTFNWRENFADSN